MAGITLSDVLDIKYMGKWMWSPDGASIAFVLDDGGIFDLWLLDTSTGAQRQLSSAHDAVADFDFNPATGELALVMDGAVYRADPRSQDLPALWIKTEESISQVAWSPDGTMLAFLRAGKLATWRVGDSSLLEVKVPGRVNPGYLDTGRALGWSPDSQLICYSFVDDRKERHVGISDTDGRLVFRTHDREASVAPAFVDRQTLYFARMKERNLRADFCLLTIDRDDQGRAVAGEVRAFHSDSGDGQGSLLSVTAHPSPDGRQLLFLRETDGWAHLHVYDRGLGTMRQLTHGPCEDFAHAGDIPQWSPSGARIVYASSQGELHQRHLFLLDITTGEQLQLEELPGNNSLAQWSPDGRRIAFLHCDVHRSMDLWLMDVDDRAKTRQVTFSMPPAWTEENVPVAEHVTYQGAQDWEIHAFLTRPKPFDPGKKYKALVWVHGGPIRQMRQGFHPLHSYAVFYAYHQYLAHRGYVSLSINFRGGTGYGRRFRMGLHGKMGIDDVVDVVKAGEYLKSLPYVDPDRVAVWGLSYGGYMTLHALTQYPDTFCMGVNIAGIWDFAQWTRWIQSRTGMQGGLFVNFLGGFPDEAPDSYRRASPVTFAEQLARPLINVHGTADANVDFQQLDRIVSDCVKLGKAYEAYYYPDEVHMFRWRKTWQDAFPKIEREFDKYLA
ncbi:MAG TPA: hypothetical protein DCM14_07300 [Clostridiales bacterium UBA8153]|nr:hypothetical protein [Clostridiales bacterium UBA8153]